MDRGTKLEKSSFLDFFLNTYEGEVHEPRSARGAPSNERVPYLEGTGHGKRCRIIRSAGHETMPNFIGEWFPRNNVARLHEFYCASALALLKPWRDISDLKTATETFQESLERYLTTGGTKSEREEWARLLDNIQYYHECHDAAAKKRQSEREEELINHEAGREEDDALDVADVPDIADVTALTDYHEDGLVYTQEDVETEMAKAYSTDDKLYAEVALNIAEDNAIFSDHYERAPLLPTAENATYDEMEEFIYLEKLVKSVTKKRQGADNRGDIALPANPGNTGIPEEPTVTAFNGKIELPHVNLLNEEQKRAHAIILNHVEAYIEGKQPKQTLMLLMGQGGTGKSTLLNAITTTFELLGVPDLLAKTALSGVAATLIGGTTLHWFGGLPTRKIPQADIWPDKASKSLRERRIKNIENVLWITVDEVSMCTLDQITLLSQVVGKVRSASAASTTPFGGANIMLMGDFHQLPPVAGKNNALYSTPGPRNSAVVGRVIYEQFDTVINLTEQMRMTDEGWNDILQRSREGDCTEEDLKEIRKLMLGSGACEDITFSKPPWDDAVLITPRNCVRAAWNRGALERHCALTGKQN